MPGGARRVAAVKGPTGRARVGPRGTASGSSLFGASCCLPAPTGLRRAALLLHVGQPSRDELVGVWLGLGRLVALNLVTVTILLHLRVHHSMLMELWLLFP